MTTTLVLNDARTLARIIHVAHRFGCGYIKLSAERNGDTYAVSIDLVGPSDALRRLNAHITKLDNDDKELFHDESLL